MQQKTNEAVRLRILLDKPCLNAESPQEEATTMQKLVSYMAEQLALARDLLRVETIQRAEAFELNETPGIQSTMRRGPASVVSISRQRHQA